MHHKTLLLFLPLVVLLFLPICLDRRTVAAYRRTCGQLFLPLDSFTLHPEKSPNVVLGLLLGRRFCLNSLTEGPSFPCLSPTDSLTHSHHVVRMWELEVCTQKEKKETVIKRS